MIKGLWLLRFVVIAPFTYLIIRKTWEQFGLSDYGKNGYAGFALNVGKSFREMYGGEIWAKERKVRPFESIQFGKNWE